MAKSPTTALLNLDNMGPEGNRRIADAAAEANIAVRDIDKHSLRITGFDRMGKILSLEDEAFIQTLERRILSGASRPHEVLSDEDARIVDEIGVEAKVQFQVKGEKFDASLDTKTIKRPEKPMPTLADDLLVSKTHAMMERRTSDYAKSLLRGAEKFVLTKDAAIRVGEAIRAYPEMLVDHGWFARPPFETCWIEFPAEDFHDAITQNWRSPLGNHDTRVGYLFHGNDVYVAASNDVDRRVDFSPIVYCLHKPNTHAEEVSIADFFRTSRGQLDNFYWGKTVSEGLKPEVLRGLRAQHGFSIKAADEMKGLMDTEKWLGFSAGEVRNIIGILLMINQPSGIIRTDTVERRKRMTVRGTQVLMAHSIVTLNIDRRSKPSRLLQKPSGSHGSPRWHMVMDHWCNDKIARSRGWSFDDAKTHGTGDHAHLWDTEEGPKGQLIAKCAICGGRRWRRKMKNGRGDRSKGTVAQDRVIITDHDHIEKEYAC